MTKIFTPEEAVLAADSAYCIAHMMVMLKLVAVPDIPTFALDACMRIECKLMTNGLRY